MLSYLQNKSNSSAVFVSTAIKVDFMRNTRNTNIKLPVERRSCPLYSHRGRYVLFLPRGNIILQLLPILAFILYYSLV